MEKKIGKSAKLLIINDLIYHLVDIFINTFLVAYFLKITNKSITTISIYYIIIYSLHGIGNVLMGKVIKSKPSKSKQIMCLGIVGRALFVLLIVILSERIASYFVLVAVLNAISRFLYWCAHELIYIDVTTNDNRKNYMSINKILGKTVGIVSPIILGTSIELYSFTKIALYVFVLSLIQIVISLLINTDIENIEKSNYNFKNLLKYIKENKLKKIQKYGFSSFAYGIIESSISTLIVIITLMTFKTSFNLGILTTVFSLCSMVSLMLYNKFYNKKNAKFILGLSSVVVVFGVVGLLIDINKMTLIIYNFCYTITFCIFDALYNTRKGDLVKECHIEKYKEEFIGYASLTIAMGRVIGYVLMLFVSFSVNIVFFKILLAITVMFAPVYCYFISSSERE